ncbi:MULTISPECIES: GNAT family N-acetyltransferase [Streptomyces]|uniref:Acetyltransferase n=2 Tax=Streptomyces TaxID=1883 RepID=A0A0W7WSZ1_9ACTN|nr:MULTISPECIES: GNAT family N-acetyltransferase [Streptomyces]KUF13697.1 acetyltransferase [Streptomyces silvensis]MVO84854.1 GNAT family N-acetyltransferase [Streptomyces typhae]
MEPVTLTTERLLLRTFSPADTEEVYAACQDPEIQRWTTMPSPYARADAEGFIGRMVPDGWRLDMEYTFSVRPREGGPLLAATSLHHPRAGSWEIGFWTGKEHRGRGYMTETVHALAHWAFTRLGCNRLEWRAEVGNTASRAVAEKAGFTMEGTLRAALLNKGTLRDTWIASLLPSDLDLTSPQPYLPPAGTTPPGA